MKSWRYKGTVGGRALVRARIVFVVMGGAAAIWIGAERGPLQQREELPTVLKGQVTTRLPGVRVDHLNVVLRRGSNLRLPYTQSVVTDESARFSFKGHFSGTVRITVGVNNESCVYRPIGPIAVPRSAPLAIDLVEGAAVSGRLIRDGKPVANVQLRLRQVEFDVDSVRREAQTKSDDQGRFRFVHLGDDSDYYAFTLLDSLSQGATMVPRRLRTGVDATTLDLGDIEVGQGRTLAGRVILPDGKALDRTIVIGVQCLVSRTAMRQRPDSRGHFRFEGLPDGPIAV